MNVDPMDALTGFETALRQKSISTSTGELNPALAVHLDHPDGVTPRFSYALLDDRPSGLFGKTKVKAISVLVADKPHEGLLCFHIAYATAVAFRGKGHAVEVVKSSARELLNGMSRNGIKSFYIEAVIDADNIASQRVIERALNTKGKRNIGGEGLPVVHYMALVE